MLVGAGPKANQPLILQRGGTPYRGFLEGAYPGRQVLPDPAFFQPGAEGPRKRTQKRGAGVMNMNRLLDRSRLEFKLGDYRVAPPTALTDPMLLAARAGIPAFDQCPHDAARPRRHPPQDSQGRLPRQPQDRRRVHGAGLRRRRGVPRQPRRHGADRSARDRGSRAPPVQGQRRAGHDRRRVVRPVRRPPAARSRCCDRGSPAEERSRP